MWFVINGNYAATGSGNGFIFHCSSNPDIKPYSQIDTITSEEKVTISLTFNSNLHITDDMLRTCLKINIYISDVHICLA